MQGHKGVCRDVGVQIGMEGHVGVCEDPPTRPSEESVE